VPAASRPVPPVRRFSSRELREIKKLTTTFCEVEQRGWNDVYCSQAFGGRDFCPIWHCCGSGSREKMFVFGQKCIMKLPVLFWNWSAFQILKFSSWYLFIFCGFWLSFLLSLIWIHNTSRGKLEPPVGNLTTDCIYIYYGTLFKVYVADTYLCVHRFRALKTMSWSPFDAAIQEAVLYR
jgi:hypothetical protein